MPESLRFQLDLIDKMTKPGKEMEAQLKKLKVQLGAAEKAVRATEQAINKMQKSKVVDIKSYRDLTHQLGQQQHAVSGFRSAILGMAQPMEEASEGMTGQIAKGVALGNVYVKLGEYVLKAAAAIGSLGFKGMEFAIEASEAKNDTLDALDAFLGSAEEVDYVYNSIVDIGDHVAMSQAKGRDLAVQLSAAGVTNSKLLVDAIESIGQVSSILGEGAGSKIQSIIERSQASGKFQLSAKQLKGTGVSNDMVAQAMGITPKQLEAQMKAGTITAEKGVAALTKAVSNKFAGVAAKQVLDLPAQITKAKDDFAHLFEDVKVEGFLTSLKGILSILDQNTAAGQALKYVVDTVFSGLFAAVETVMPFVKAFFKGLIIIALQVYIALRPLIKTISDAFGGDNSSAVESFAGFMSKLGEVIGWVVSQFVSVAQVGISVIQTFVQIETYVVGLISSFFSMGANLVTGLVDGIKSMASAPVDAIKNMASGALNSFKGVFGIHSPSKVMGQMGGHLMTGLEEGIDDGSTAPGAAMADAVAPPVASGGSGKGGGGGNVTITMAPGSVVISGISNAQQLQDLFPGMLADAAEQLMLQTGTG